MGNSDLRTLASIQTVEDTSLSGSTVAIDTYNWLYSYLTMTVKFRDESEYTTRDGLNQYPNIISALRGLPLLFKHNLTPVFIFDGAAHDLKAAEQESRRELRENRKELAEQARERGDYKEARRLKSQSQVLTPELVRTTRELFATMGIPCVDAPSAGEAQTAHMTQQGVADFALSDDWDSLLFGSETTVRFLSGERDVERVSLTDTLNHHDITHEQLVDIAILCGTDYNDGVYRVGPKTALSGVKKHGDVFSFLEEKDKTIQNVEELRNIFLSPDVTDSYLVPNSVTPDIQNAESYAVSELGLPEESVLPELTRLRDSV